jgi:hypothetical protein
MQGVEFICANTDAQALATAAARDHVRAARRAPAWAPAPSPRWARPPPRRPRASASARPSKAPHLLFITAGMGGGTGTGAAPVIAKVAKDMGILTVGVVTKPFDFEGTRRTKIADTGVAELEASVDSLIVVLNEKLLDVLGDDVTQEQAFSYGNDVLKQRRRRHLRRDPPAGPGEPRLPGRPHRDERAGQGHDGHRPGHRAGPRHQGRRDRPWPARCWTASTCQRRARRAGADRGLAQHLQAEPRARNAMGAIKRLRARGCATSSMAPPTTSQPGRRSCASPSSPPACRRPGAQQRQAPIIRWCTAARACAPARTTCRCSMTQTGVQARRLGRPGAGWAAGLQPAVDAQRVAQRPHPGRRQGRRAGQQRHGRDRDPGVPAQAGGLRSPPRCGFAAPPPGGRRWRAGRAGPRRLLGRAGGRRAERCLASAFVVRRL